MSTPPALVLRTLLFFLCCCCLGVTGIPESFSQTLIDSQGKDFWLTFLPNFHRYKAQSNLRQSDSLYIFITSQEPTTGLITYTNKAGQEFARTFSITDPTQIYTMRLPNEGFELEGFNDSGRLANNGGQAELPALQTFHVESDEEVTVYALSQANTTSDAFLALPTDALGKDYTVLAYTSDPGGGGGFGQHNETPSQFAIVATENETEVTIAPSARTYRYGAALQTVTLQRGQAYLVQADMRAFETLDLTGTRVQSNKPIAIFAGHQRATVPLNDGQSRDVLIEQLPPVETWGQSVFLVPYTQPSDARNMTVKDRFRIMAAFDNTEVRIDGQLITTLAAGGFYEGVLNRPMYATATGPVLVAQYKQTAPQGISNDGLGDPFMMFVPPSEQFLPGYRLISAQAADERGGITYLEQYVTVIAPTSKISTVRLDGTPVDPTLFSPVVSSGYSYASLRTTDGVHSVQADTGIGVYVYGYGAANSYGYIGGTNFTPLDVQPPRLHLDTACFHLDGFLVDDARGDTRIQQVEFPADSLKNVRINIIRTSDARDSLLFTADLTDPYTDGSFFVHARDSVGFELKKTVHIPGFTVRSTLPGVPLPVEQVLEPIVGDTICADYMLYNNGSFPQTILSMVFAHSTAGFMIQNPMVGEVLLQPGDSVAVTLCFTIQEEGSYTDTLVIGDGCTVRPVLAFTVMNHADDVQPPRLHLDTTCFHLDGVLFDNARSDSYIDMVDFPVDSMDNVFITPGRTSAGRDSVLFTADLLDPYADGSFFVVARDSAGMTLARTVRFPGFTVSSVLTGVQTLNVALGGSLCADYTLRNDGGFPQTVTSATFAAATAGFTVSTPLPLVLAPGDSAVIRLCFTPPGDGVFADTLVIGNDCITRVALAFRIATQTAVATLAMGTVRAQAGSTFLLPVRLVHAELLQESGVTGFRIGLRYNGTILSCRNTDTVSKQRKGGEERIVIDIPASHNGDSVLVKLRFFAGLAVDTVSTLEIDMVTPLGGVADVSTVPGLFTLDGVCYEGGARLLNPEGRIALMPVRPNPVEGSTQVDIETVETGRTRLTLVDMQGQTVKIVLDGEVPPGVQTLDIDVGGLAGGRYFLLLETPTETLMQAVEVVR